MMTPLDRYSCEQVLHLLDDYLDRELTPEETGKVEEHLETCAECAAESKFESSLLSGLKEKLRHIEVPNSALEKVREVLRREAGE
ncbi:MAG: zf-HC2 domain-containing protein [Gemmatimonadota bacterium]|nr:zf-HC2 domain-containing protein [Gemmatimonadota bacterium]